MKLFVFSRQSCLIIITLIHLGSLFNIDTDHPIIYRNPGLLEYNGTYFGYSVALMKGHVHNSYSILVGSPQETLSPTNHNSLVKGDVYICTEDGSCEILNFTNHYSPETIAGDKLPDLNSKGLSVGSTVSASRDGSISIICGLISIGNITEWSTTKPQCFVRFQKSYQQFDDFILGLPVSGGSHGNHESHPFSWLGEMSGLAKISSHIDEDDNVMVGMPLYDNFKGLVSLVKIRKWNEVSELSSYKFDVILASTSNIPELTSYSYFGYAMTSGYFVKQKEISYMASAIGYQNKGGVILFNYPDKSSEDLKVHTIIQGFNEGELFGVSIVRIDINNDGLDDFLIGSPNHTLSNGQIVGKAYLFVNQQNGLFSVARKAPIGSPDSKFGTSIVPLGDIDMDGYADFAVGAPREEGGRVYIYNGRSEPVYFQLTQTIKARDFGKDIKGFGFSFSRSVDIDSNNYPDIVVGCPSSEHAILLRSRPVVQFLPTLEADVKSLPRIPNYEFTLTSCLQYISPYSLEAVDVKIQIHVIDRIANIGMKNNNYASSLFYTLMMSSSDNHCRDWKVKLKSNVEDFTKPLILEMSRRVIQSPLQKYSQDAFCPGCPVESPSAEKEILLVIPFMDDCSTSVDCLADLSVTASIPNNSMTLPATPGYDNVTLLVNVSNWGSSRAFNTRVIAQHPPDLYLVTVPSGCSSYHDDPLSLECVVGTIDVKDERMVSLVFGIRPIFSRKKKLLFNVRFNTASELKHPSTSSVDVILHTKSTLKLQIQGWSKNALLDWRDEKHEGLKAEAISHQYQVKPLTLYTPTSIVVIIRVPHKWKGFLETFLTIQSAQVRSLNMVSNCVKEKTSHSDSHDLEATTMTSVIPMRNAGQHATMTCEQDAVECQEMRCIVGPFDELQPTFSIELAFIVDKLKMGELNVKNVTLISTACIDLSEWDVDEVGGVLHSDVVTTILMSGSHSTSQPVTWDIMTIIIIVVVILGVILVCLIICFKMRRKVYNVVQSEEKDKQEMDCYA